MCDIREERTIASLFRLNYLILPEACGTVNETRAISSGPPESSRQGLN